MHSFFCEGPACRRSIGRHPRGNHLLPNVLSILSGASATHLQSCSQSLIKASCTAFSAKGQPVAAARNPRGNHLLPNVLSIPSGASATHIQSCSQSLIKASCTALKFIFCSARSMQGAASRVYGEQERKVRNREFPPPCPASHPPPWITLSYIYSSSSERRSEGVTFVEQLRKRRSYVVSYIV